VKQIQFIYVRNKVLKMQNFVYRRALL